jgi:sugar lactone lactonase YvrE
MSSLNGNVWKSYLSSDALFDYIFKLYVDNDNRIWGGTLGGVFVLENDSIDYITTDNGLVYNQVEDITQDARGHYWFATKYGASEFDGSNWYTYNANHGLPENRVTCVAADQKGNVWIGTLDNGLVKIEITENQ